MTYTLTTKPGSTIKPKPKALSGTFDTVVNAIGSAVAGATASFLSMGAPQYKVVGGVAKAANQGTLDAFKALQTQINRVAKQKNFTVIAVDGAIGPGTAAAMVSVNAAAAKDYSTWSQLRTSAQLNDPEAAGSIKYMADLIALPTTIDGIAANVLGYYRLVRQYADALSAPPSVASPPPAAPPSYVDISGKVVTQSSAASVADAWKRLGTGTQLLAVGGLGLAAFYMLGKRGKRRK